MTDATKKIYLTERDIPEQWYNIIHDMPNKPQPPLHPATRKPVTPEDLTPLFPMELIKQEASTEKWIPIPGEVRELYRLWRPSPLIRAFSLEKALDTPAKIYYKYEGLSPSGSHKPNTAIAQAYYNAKEGVKCITTETGAGQWGSALSFACKHFNISCEVFMVRISYDSKPYRKVMMNTWGALVHSSPTSLTDAGKKILERNPNSTGSLGIAISEAIERAAKDAATKYSLGSVLNHVLMHQTIIGLEARKQFEILGELPDIIVAPFGGGSNFAGIAFPFLEMNFLQGRKIRCIASEPASCPKLTRGAFRYDYGDAVGFTPLLPMYTLGHTFVPAPIHAGGLRYHGAGSIVSQLLYDKHIEARAQHQLECMEAGKIFAETEGLISAPEANHAIATVIKEAERCKEEGVSRTILFNLCGHGYFDMQAYSDYLDGKLKKHIVTDNEIQRSLEESDIDHVNYH